MDGRAGRGWRGAEIAAARLDVGGRCGTVALMASLTKLFLSAVLAVSLAACGGSEDQSTEEVSPQTTRSAGAAAALAKLRTLLQDSTRFAKNSGVTQISTDGGVEVVWLWEPKAQGSAKIIYYRPDTKRALAQRSPIGFKLVAILDELGKSPEYWFDAVDKGAVVTISQHCLGCKDGRLDVAFSYADGKITKITSSEGETIVYEWAGSTRLAEARKALEQTPTN